MKGLAFKGRRRLELKTFDDPTPGPGEVVLAIKASGLCGSDLHAYRREADIETDIICGHEPAGEVVAVGQGVVNPIAKVGRRVMVHHYSGCGACADCNTGWRQMCSEVPMKLYGGTAHGAHAEYMKVAADTLLSLDERLSFQAGAAISCGTGTAWGALDRMNVSARDTLLVVGQGPVGLSATMLGAALGARVIALDLSDDRLALAKRFGADETINASSGGIVEAVRACTGGKGASKVMETSGSSQGAADGLACLAKWGTLGLIGLGARLELETSAVFTRQISVLTSWSMSWNGQKACSDFILSKKLDVEPLFTDRFALEDAVEAYTLFDRQARGKAVFLF